MTILNKNKFPYIKQSGNTYEIDWTSKTYIFSLRDWSDKDHWYCEINSGDPFSHYKIEHLIETDILRKIKSDDKTFLVIANSYEGFLHIVEPLYRRLVIESRIPANKIILLSESIDVGNEIKSVAKQYSQNLINFEWLSGFEYMTKKYKAKLTQSPLTLEMKDYEKSFLNFNRRWRMHRPTIVAALATKGILEKGFVSLGNDGGGKDWSNIFNDIDYFHQNKNLKDLMNQYKENIRTLPDLYLDTENLKENQADLTELTNYYYENSYFSLVSESNFYTTRGFENSRFLTEKTFKPIIQGHPFLLISVPNSLKVLKILGYKTFHPFIDESYDAELDDELRMLKIIAEVEKLCNLSKNDLKSFLLNSKSIAEFNKNKILNKKSFSIKII